MRDCPVCGSSSRTVVDPDYMNFELYKCVCGMHYVDHISLSQEWFDRYYMTVYKTDDKSYSDKRLNSLASFVASYDPPKRAGHWRDGWRIAKQDSQFWHSL